MIILRPCAGMIWALQSHFITIAWAMTPLQHDQPLEADRPSWLWLSHGYNEKQLRLGPFRVPEAFILHVFQSLAKALQFLYHVLWHDDPSSIQPDAGSHEEIVRRLKKKWPTTNHLDVKLHNLLISQSQSIHIPGERLMAFPFSFIEAKTLELRPRCPRTVLADFGTACQEDDNDWKERDAISAGTFGWMHPELPKWTERATYGLWVLLFYHCAGYYPRVR